ncbi:MAG: hypothetical protein JSU87_00680 [Gemmatimonadota bacterium]|nr:MAG: hypothetical protein JSU87_00680 [Gemmatimonadota bacterium]
MPVIRKVYLPAWAPWLAQMVVFPLWLWLTRNAFLVRDSARLGVGTWAEASFVLLVVSLYLFLMGYRKFTVHITCRED